LLIGEYQINLSREIGYDPGRPNVPRRRMVAFAVAIPSLRIAVGLKVELFPQPRQALEHERGPRHRYA
jgi:hypothetical protein